MVLGSREISSCKCQTNLRCFLCEARCSYVHRSDSSLFVRYTEAKRPVCFSTLLQIPEKYNSHKINIHSSQNQHLSTQSSTIPPFPFYRADLILSGSDTLQLSFPH